MEKLKEEYPEARCQYNYNNTFQLLIATILSAQSTDKKVNEVTEELFREYKTPTDFLSLAQTELEEKIRKIGLYRNKAKHILEMCRILLEKYNGSSE